jgi:hypothetical protein
MSDVDLHVNKGSAIAQAVSRQLLTARAGFEPGSGHVGLVVDKVPLGQVFSAYFCFPLANLHSTDCSTIIIIIYHLELVQYAKQQPQYQVDSVSLREKKRIPVKKGKVVPVLN